MFYFSPLAILASMTRKQLEIAGAMLYACEGTKARRNPSWPKSFIYAIELTNSNPKIIGLFAKFLSKILKVKHNRLRGQLFVYPDHDVNKLIAYWSEISGISVKQFQKPIILKQKNSKYKPNPLGTFKIRYNHKVDFLRLQKMIENVWRDAGVA